MKDGFCEYESHIDNLINQYKSQLDKIKQNRENKEKDNTNRMQIKNSTLQENNSFQINDSHSIILGNTKHQINLKNDSTDYLRRKTPEESFHSAKIVHHKDENFNKNAFFEDKEKKYEIFNHKEHLNKLNTHCLIPNEIERQESAEINKKLSTLNEENLRLNRKITELIKNNEKVEELMTRNDRLKCELNNLIESESKLKRELADSYARYDLLEKRSKMLEELELKYNEDNSKLKYKLKEVESFYEHKIKNENEQVYIVNNKLNEQEKEMEDYKHILEKFNLFIKNNLRHFKDEINIREEDIEGKCILKNSEYDLCFASIEKFINKLKYDNTELVKYINKKLNKNHKEDKEYLNKIQNLNEKINDLKLENSILKNQLNNLIEEQNPSRRVESIRVIENDYNSEVNIKRKKKVYKESFEKNTSSNSYNPSRALTPLKALTVKTVKNNKKNNAVKIMDDSQSNYDSEVSTSKGGQRSQSKNKKISHFPQKKRIESASEYENVAQTQSKNLHYNTLTPIQFYNQDNDKEFHNKSYSPKRGLISKNEEGTHINQSNNDGINISTYPDMRSHKEVHGEFTLSKDLSQLEGLKYKIKELESKILEINKDDKEKQIIDSIREYRNRNITSPEKNNIY